MACFSHFETAPFDVWYEKGRQLTACSMGLSVLTVLFLAMTREAYAIVVAFLLFVIKMALIWMSRA